MTSPGSSHKPLLGAALLLCAAVIWGFAFVPQRLTVVAFLPLQATAIRFALAAPLAVIIAGKRLFHPGVPAKNALLLGVILFIAYATQTGALVYAPVARVSLITGMYAVFVPLLAPLLGHARPTIVHWTGAVLAFAGLLALTGAVGNKDILAVPLNIGDVLVLAHAFVSAFQVLLIGKLARDADPFALNALQLTAVMLLAIPAALVVEGMPNFHGIGSATWMSFGYLCAFSTVVAFTCQIFGQRHTSPPTAAVIMLLETPIGVLAALFFLGEKMAWSQWLGAVVLVGGVGLSLWGEIKRSAAASHPQPAA